VNTALEMAQVSPGELKAKAFSLAGADWPEDFAFLEAELGRFPCGGGALIVNDAIGALRAGSPDGYGVAAVCGTYAVSAARAPGGRSWHAGFWQETGGGTKLGEEALWAVYRAELGIDPPTSLTAAVLAAAGQDTVEDMLHAFTARHSEPPVEVASLARNVLEQAEAGDATARRIVEEQGTIMGDYALAAARQVGLEGSGFTLVLTGGVFRHPSDLLAEAVVARVRQSVPEVRPLRSRFEPVVGALLFAFEHAGVPVDNTLLDRLATTLPPGSLFDS
jgi:N-acetylglucosamine kinase-like BadF-type ATPase